MKIHLGLLLLVVVFAGVALARAADTAPRVLTDVAFLTPGRTEKLDVYLPAPPTDGKLSPAVVWIHGGGWTAGEKGEARAKEICGVLNGAGYVALSINYQLGDGAWPTNLLDCKNAVRFLRAHAAEYHVDPDRIAVAGGSAGGHLALMVGLTMDEAALEPTGATTPYPGVSSRVRAVVDLYGITNLQTRGEKDATGALTATAQLMAKSRAAFGAAPDASEVLRVASPVAHVTKNSPPIMLLHGRADVIVDFPQSEKLTAILKTQGIEHELVLLDGVGHTFNLETWNEKPMARDLRPVVLAFLAKHLAPTVKK